MLRTFVLGLGFVMIAIGLYYLVQAWAIWVMGNDWPDLTERDGDEYDW